MPIVTQLSAKHWRRGSVEAMAAHLSMATSPSKWTVTTSKNKATARVSLAAACCSPFLCQYGFLWMLFDGALLLLVHSGKTCITGIHCNFVPHGHAIKIQLKYIWNTSKRTKLEWNCQDFSEKKVHTSERYTIPLWIAWVNSSVFSFPLAKKPKMKTSQEGCLTTTTR